MKEKEREEGRERERKRESEVHMEKRSNTGVKWMDIKEKERSHYELCRVSLH